MEQHLWLLVCVFLHTVNRKRETSRAERYLPSKGMLLQEHTAYYVSKGSDPEK